VIGYVLNGAIESQVKGQLEQTLTAGKAFYEPAQGVHAVAKNASATEPSKFLAIFICDQDMPLTVPAADRQGVFSNRRSALNHRNVP
jgi:quercetin dioxygenase-like cupin family protein